MTGGYFTQPRDEYEIRFARNPGNGREFFNAWHIPTDEYVGAGFSAADISRQVDEHKAREGK